MTEMLNWKGDKPQINLSFELAHEKMVLITNLGVYLRLITGNHVYFEWEVVIIPECDICVPRSV